MFWQINRIQGQTHDSPVSLGADRDLELIFCRAGPACFYIEMKRRLSILVTAIFSAVVLPAFAVQSIVDTLNLGSTSSASGHAFQWPDAFQNPKVVPQVMKGLEAIDSPDAFSGPAARRCLYEASAIEPGRDSDKAGQTNQRNLGVGTNYGEPTAKGLTREPGYVGCYGEVPDWAWPGEN